MSKLINQILILKKEEKNFNQIDVEKINKRFEYMCIKEMKKAANTFVEAIDIINE